MSLDTKGFSGYYIVTGNTNSKVFCSFFISSGKILEYDWLINKIDFHKTIYIIIEDSLKLINPNYLQKEKVHIQKKSSPYVL